MASRKESIRSSRQLLQACLDNGQLHIDRVKQVARSLAERKPRNYTAILDAFLRSVRLELDKRHAVVESAQGLNGHDQWLIHEDLRKKHGADVTAEFKVTPELLGGMRIKIGSNVLDGSVRARLQALQEKLA